MNAAIIPLYLDARMKELGHCNGYVMRIKHYVLGAQQSIKIPAFGEIFFLLEPVPDVWIESDLGIYSATASTSEQQHEHSGQIFVANLSADGDCNVQFVQAIPLESNPDCKTCND